MNEEKLHTGRVPLSYDRRGGQRSTSIHGLVVGTASCLAILVLLAFHGFGSFTTWTSPAHVQRTLQPQAVSRLSTNPNPENGFGISECPATTTKSINAAHITPSANLILLRDTNDDATANSNGQDVDTQSLITDSDGTWVIVSSGDLTVQPYSQTTTTTIETVSLTDQIIVSYKTQTQTQTATETETETETTVLDRFITITITGGKDTSQDPNTISTAAETTTPSNSRSFVQDSSTTAKTASATSFSTTTNTPQSPSPQDPQTTSPPPTPTIPSPDTTTCPWLTCATSCPWTTCNTNAHPPTIMETILCQMLDPCWDRVNKAPSQGGDCACLCESGYCHPHMKPCSEWDCCHQCECFKDYPMSLQKGDGC